MLGVFELLDEWLDVGELELLGVGELELLDELQVEMGHSEMSVTAAH